MTIQEIIDAILSIFKQKNTKQIYFINPNPSGGTPLTDAVIKDIADKKVTDVAIRTIQSDQDWAIYYKNILKYKEKFAKYGITTQAWVWNDFNEVGMQFLADNGIPVIKDIETYSMENEVPEIKRDYAICKGKVDYVVCVKAEGWDGGQLYTTIAQYCTKIMPMLYTGDYLQTNAGLSNFVKSWNEKLPNKIWPCLETYESDANPVPKSDMDFINEIYAVMNYCDGVAYFRYGSNVSTFKGLISETIPDDVDDDETTTSGTEITVNKLLEVASDVAEYVQVNQAEPQWIAIGDKGIGPNRYTTMICQLVYNLVSNDTGDIKIPETGSAKSPTGGTTEGQLPKEDYSASAKGLVNYVATNKRLPNYLPSAIGQLSRFNVIDMYSRIAKYYKDQGQLPNFVYAKSVGTSVDTTITNESMFTVATTVSEYIQSNSREPSSFSVGNNSVSANQYAVMICQFVYNLGKGSSDTIKIPILEGASNPVGGISSGQITKDNYLDAAKRLIDYVVSNSKMPNYLTTTAGQFSRYNIIDMYSRIAKFYKENSNQMASFAYVSRTSGSSNTEETSDIPNDIRKYLNETANCQVTNSSIKSLASSLKTGSAIFNYIRDIMTYSYYYNTRKGAVKSISDKVANCCDQTHAVIAIARAAGIPARYVHSYCRFSSGWYGHVYAEFYINGKWVVGDTINKNNSLGNITNWNTSTVTVYNRYLELPF